jgi:capsular polysaccharide biosynthesis protein
MDDKRDKVPLYQNQVVIRLIQNLPYLVGAVFISVLLLAGGYFLGIWVTYVPTYQVETKYYVEYGVDPRVSDAYTYINAYSWNAWLHADEMAKDIKSHLSFEIDEEVLKRYLFADLPGDLRIPVTIVTTEDEELSLAIARATAEAMITFGDRQKEISSIRVIHSPTSTTRIPMVEEPWKLIGISAFLSLFSVFLVFVCSEFLSDGIWLPSYLERRWGLQVLGTPLSPGLGEHIRYFFCNGGSVGITTITDTLKPQLVRQVLYDNTDISEVKDFIPLGVVIDHPESCSKLREMDKVLLAVPAGKHMGHKLDYVLHYLALQNCEVTAVILWSVK